MKNINYKKITFATALSLFLLILAVFIQTNKINDPGVSIDSSHEVPESTKEQKEDYSLPTTPLQNNPESNTKTEVLPIKTKIIVGEKTIDAFSEEGKTLYEILEKLKNEESLDFKSKEFSGLGFLITEIDEMKSGDGKYLIYYINNQEASVGVSSYIPNNGDVVEWKLK